MYISRLKRKGQKRKSVASRAKNVDSGKDMCDMPVNDSNEHEKIESDDESKGTPPKKCGRPRKRKNSMDREQDVHEHPYQ